MGVAFIERRLSLLILFITFCEKVQIKCENMGFKVRLDYGQIEMMQIFILVVVYILKFIQVFYILEGNQMT
jgi:hypothetical protein